MRTTTPILLLALVALAACGDDGGSSSGGGKGGSSSGDGDGDGDGDGGKTASSSSTGLPGTSTGNGSTSTSGPTTNSASSGSDGGSGPGTGGSGPGTGGSGPGTGGGEPVECDAAQVFEDLDLQECVGETCCDELTVCGNDPADCFGDDGFIDTSLPGGEDLNHCLSLSGCIGAPVCDSGITFSNDPLEFGDPTLEFATCLSENCCDEMNFCTDGTEDTQSCLDCLLGDFGELCDPVNLCSSENCDGALFLYDYCDSGLGSLYEDIGECVTDSCCEEYVDCTGGVDNDGDPLDQDQLDDCLACLNDEDGGPLCDDAIACVEDNCNSNICDSGLTIPDLAQAACLTTNCCEEYNDCTDGGADPDACLDCFADEGGDLCDAALECGDTNCPGE